MTYNFERLICKMFNMMASDFYYHAEINTINDFRLYDTVNGIDFFLKKKMHK